MYGDTLVMRRRAAQLREQGEDIRAMAEQLVTHSGDIDWTGRAADAMRERIRDRAAHLRDAANAYAATARNLGATQDQALAMVLERLNLLPPQSPT